MGARKQNFRRWCLDTLTVIAALLVVRALMLLGGNPLIEIPILDPLLMQFWFHLRGLARSVGTINWFSTF